jgi:hypothetical protein
MVWDADGNYHDMRDEVAEMDANAALIAAAPDLMEALERIERIVRPGTEYTISTAIDAMCEIWNGARAAIAKATDIKEV